MRLTRLAGAHLGPFKAFDIDFSTLPEIVCLVGENGEGKSTFLELIPGAFYRKTPTRGPLAFIAREKGAWLEMVADGVTFRHTLNPKAGTGEVLLRDADGKPLLDSALRGEFDRWSKIHLPPPAVFFSSTFIAQGKEGFLAMDPGDRKGVILRAKGLEGLEAKSKRAGEMAKVWAAKAASAAAGEDALRGASYLVTPEQVEEARAALVAAQGDLARATTRAARVSELGKAWDLYEAAAAKVASAKAKVEDVEAQAKTLSERIANNRAVLAKRAAIEEADARVAELTKALAIEEAASAQRAKEIGTARATRRAQRQVRVDAATSAEESAARAAEDALRASRSEQEAAKALRHTEAQRERAALRDVLTEVVRTNDRRKRAISDAIEAHHGQRPERAPRLRKAIDDVVQAALVNDTCPVDLERLEKVQALDDAFLRGEEMAAWTARADRMKKLAARFMLKVDSVQTEASRLPQAVEAEIIHYAEQAKLATERHAALAERSRLAALAHQAAAAALAAEPPDADPVVDDGAIIGLRVKLSKFDVEAVKTAVTRLTQAEGRIEELLPHETRLAEECAAIRAARDALPVPVTPSAPRLQADPADDIAAIEKRVVALSRAHENARATEVASRETLEKAAALQATRLAAEREAAEWGRLMRDLGRDGLQALEIDAAGPEFDEIANTLLRHCVGHRWTVSLQTIREGDKGKEFEGCFVQVSDAKTGYVGDAKFLSGGEKVLVGDALAWALVVMGCRSAKIEGATIVRDESAAALDEGRSELYIVMLRKALRMAGAARVLYVNHSPAIQRLADAWLRVKDGKITVEAVS